VVNCFRPDTQNVFGNVVLEDTANVLTFEEMTKQSSFVGWDFDNVWVIGNSPDYDYPQLRGLWYFVDDEDGEYTPFPDKMVNFRGYDDIGKKDTTVEVKWGESLFRQNAEVYNHDLATLASVLSWSMYGNQKNGVYTEEPIIYKALKEDLELYGIELYNYNNFEIQGITNFDPTAKSDFPDTVGYVFGYKKIIINEQNYNLIVIAIRGTVGYEWYTDFDIGYGIDDHRSVTIAKDYIYFNLLNYISCYKLENEDIKILVTGHSRGAGVANLLAAQLTKEENIAKKENIYGRMFATMNTTTNSEAKDTKKYSNIHNFINPEDFVPYFPFSDSFRGYHNENEYDSNWQYWKYGKIYLFPAGNLLNNEYYKIYERDEYFFETRDRYFKNLTGKDFKTYYGIISPRSMMKQIFDFAPNTNSYYFKKYDAGILLGPLSTFEYLQFFGDALSGDIGAFSTTLLSDFSPITSFLAFNKDKLWDSHCGETYVAWMKATSDFELPNSNEWIDKITAINIACPVDVELYDENGVLIGKVVDNIVYECNENYVNIYVVDDVKIISLHNLQYLYSLKLTGTDIGTMDYTIEIIDPLTMSTTVEKKFANIQLFDGKEMISTVGGSINIADIQLLLTDKNEIIGEIFEDGTETLFKTDESVSVIVNVITDKTNLDSIGGNIEISIFGENLIGQNIKIFFNDKDIEPVTAEIINNETAKAIIIIPANITQNDKIYILTVYLNGLNTEQYINIKVIRPNPETGITILQENVTAGNGQGNVNFNIKSANGIGYSVYISEDGENYIIYSNVNYNSKGAHIKGLTNNKTYYIKIAYTENGITTMSNSVMLTPKK